MKTMNIGDFCRVKKSKYLAAGTFVEILMTFDQGVYLCGASDGTNTIVAADNLEPIEDLCFDQRLDRLVLEVFA